jgi:hypothetical protein
VFSLKVERAPLLGPLLLYRSLDRAGPEMLQVAGCAVRLYLRVERGGGESTSDLRILCAARGAGTPRLEPIPNY